MARNGYAVSAELPSQVVAAAADIYPMRFHAFPFSTAHGHTRRSTAAAFVLLAVLLAAGSGVAQVRVSGEPPALAAPVVTR
jgi:hypothetical protein